MEYRHATYNEFGTIDCEINHPQHGWIPITLSPSDPPTAALFAKISKGPVDPYRVLVFEVNGVIGTTNQKFSIPQGVPYISLDPSEVPSEPPEIWDVDFSEPDGYGTGGQ